MALPVLRHVRKTRLIQNLTHLRCYKKANLPFYQILV